MIFKVTSKQQVGLNSIVGAHWIRAYVKSLQSVPSVPSVLSD